MCSTSPSQRSMFSAFSPLDIHEKYLLAPRGGNVNRTGLLPDSETSSMIWQYSDSNSSSGVFGKWISSGHSEIDFQSKSQSLPPHSSAVNLYSGSLTACFSMIFLPVVIVQPNFAKLSTLTVSMRLPKILRKLFFRYVYLPLIASNMTPFIIESPNTHMESFISRH